MYEVVAWIHGCLAVTPCPILLRHRYLTVPASHVENPIEQTPLQSDLYFEKLPQKGKAMSLKNIIDFLISYQDALARLHERAGEDTLGYEKLILSGEVSDFAEMLEGYYLQYFVLLSGEERARIEKQAGLRHLNEDDLIPIRAAKVIHHHVWRPLQEKVSASSPDLKNSVAVFFESAYVLCDLMARLEARIHPNAFLERLRVDPSKGAARELVRVARYLQNYTVLMVKGRPYRLCELEAYLKSPEHDDPFVHAAEEQSRFAHWYFHKRGTGYKEGTRKGLDITFGQPGLFHGGLLVRAVGALDEAGHYIDGPSLVVDEILRAFKVGKVADLARVFIKRLTREESPDLYLVSKPDLHPGEWCAGPRVGLTLKSKNFEARRSFIDRPYRFHICPDQTAHEQSLLFLSLIAQGWSGGQARLLMNMSQSACQRALIAYRKGTLLEPREYADRKLTRSELCELAGALHGRGNGLINGAELDADENDHPHFSGLKRTG